MSAAKPPGRLTIHHQRMQAIKALKICEQCEVKEFCERDHKHEEEGVFFGTVPAERYVPIYRLVKMNCNCFWCRKIKRGYYARGK